MASHKVTLCPAGCGQCPDVEIAGDEVPIGETGNLAVLKKDEWNLLVDLIQSGQASWRRSDSAAGQPHDWGPRVVGPLQGEPTTSEADGTRFGDQASELDRIHE
jgi:hypothetical protein